MDRIKQLFPEPIDVPDRTVSLAELKANNGQNGMPIYMGVSRRIPPHPATHRHARASPRTPHPAAVLHARWSSRGLCVYVCAYVRVCVCARACPLTAPGSTGFTASRRPSVRACVPRQIMGYVYDMSSGKQFYGPGGTYGFMAGYDSTVALAKFSMNPGYLNKKYTMQAFSEDELNSLAGYVRRFATKYPIVARLKDGGAMVNPA